MVRNLKGQLSMEFMIVFVGMLMIAASVTYPLYDDARAGADKLNKLLEGRNAAAKLANALNVLYAGGPGSKQTVEYSLPKGVVNIYVHMDMDGVTTTDGSISKNGRTDIHVQFDFDGDSKWDNTLDSLVLFDTILPSRWYENGDEIDDNWLIENGMGIQDWSLSIDSAHRTYHRVTLDYRFEPVSASSELLDSEQLDTGEEYEFKTTLFGYELEVEAENEGDTIDVSKFKFGGGETSGSGEIFDLILTEGDVTVTVTVAGGQISIYYSATLDEFPYPKRILITDVVMKSV